MDYQFNNIGLIGKPKEERVVKLVEATYHWLVERGFSVLIGDMLDKVPDGAEMVSKTELVRRSDLAVVIGGDGTLLRATRALADYDVPLIGVNMGRLGFLTDVLPNRLEENLDAILKGDFDEDKRYMLFAQVYRDDKEIFQDVALNDVVVQKSARGHLIELETLIDDQLLNAQRSDGLIISTPTGSTAYAMSGGGPIIHPSLDAMVLVPICPHTLSNRPIVISGSEQIEVRVLDCSRDDVQISFDGKNTLQLKVGDRITVRKKTTPVRILHPEGYDYFSLLREKLRWSEVY